MILRRFTCPNCGAVSAQAAQEIYVWCEHCDSPIDYDAPAFWRLCRQGEYKNFYGLVAAHYPAKEQAVAQGDRESFLAYEREEALRMVQELPQVFPKPARRPGEVQSRYIEWYAQCNTERRFNPKLVKLHTACVDSNIPYFQHQPGGPMGYRTFLSAEGMIKVVENNLDAARKEAEILQENGIINPCPLPFDQDYKPLISGLIQGYSPYLSGEDFVKVVQRFHLQGSFQWKSEPQTPVCCHLCGAALETGEDGADFTCTGCGAVVEEGAQGYACSGCGAPLSLPAGHDYAVCPYCSTVTNDGTFQPLKDFQSWWQKVKALAETSEEP